VFDWSRRLLTSTGNFSPDVARSKYMYYQSTAIICRLQYTTTTGPLPVSMERNCAPCQPVPGRPAAQTLRALLCTIARRTPRIGLLL